MYKAQRTAVNQGIVLSLPCERNSLHLAGIPSDGDKAGGAT